MHESWHYYVVQNDSVLPHVIMRGLGQVRSLSRNKYEKREQGKARICILLMGFGRYWYSVYFLQSRISCGFFSVWHCGSRPGVSHNAPQSHAQDHVDFPITPSMQAWFSFTTFSYELSVMHSSSLALALLSLCLRSLPVFAKSSSGAILATSSSGVNQTSYNGSIYQWSLQDVYGGKAFFEYVTLRDIFLSTSCWE